jgi:hypothetical protein
MAAVTGTALCSGGAEMISEALSEMVGYLDHISEPSP